MMPTIILTKSAAGIPVKKSVSVFALALLLTACAGGAPESTTKEGKLEQAAERQRNNAEEAADDYLDCIKDIDRKTAAEVYTNPSTRRDVVIDSCQDHATRYTIVQEQSYNNACLAKGGDSTTCDNEAVRKAQLDTHLLQQKASQRIRDTSASTRRREPQP
jgi:hypothetical protein